MFTKQQPEGLSELQRAVIYAHMGLSDTQCRHIEAMVADSGKRQVGKSALQSVRVRHQSKKNGGSRQLESHMCELVFAYWLELNPHVVGFYVQVPCRRIERTTEQGGCHVSSAHLDYLVFWRNRVELVECKTQDWLQKAIKNGDPNWVRNSDGWNHGPYAAWADRHGLPFRVWVAPQPSGTFKQNLEACYAVRNDVLDSGMRAVVDRALAMIKSKPATIEHLQQAITGFNSRLALWMLSQGMAFGPWMSMTVGLPDRFRLYGNADHASTADAIGLRAIIEQQSQKEVADPVLSASTTDLKHAHRRFRALQDILEGKAPPTVRMHILARKVDEAERRGESALSACLTSYERSGNRTPRLLVEQVAAMKTVIAEQWNKGRVEHANDLVYVYQQHCARRGVEAGGRWRLDILRRQEDPTKRALAIGGLRGFQAIRSSTDPRMRSQIPLGYGAVLHIDSTTLDHFSAPNLILNFPVAKATFYIGVDGCTTNPMATSLIFGPARTDGLALLIRDYVKRHGFLPQLIHVDRGPENRSAWLREFCEGRISLRESPTAGAAWNGLAESTIKQVNNQVAHRLPGSSKPDQKGRKVDGAFKGRRTARVNFVDMLGHFNQFVYGDLPNKPNADDRTPTERKAEAIEAYGVMGTACEWNDDFMIQTSIKVQPKRNVSHQRGIRTVEGYFTSDELLRELRFGPVQEIRRDCCYPEILRVRVNSLWLKAFHSSVQAVSTLSDEEKLFELLLSAVSRVKSRKRREKLSAERFTRMRLADAARPASAHLALPVAQAVDEPLSEEVRNLTDSTSIEGNVSSIWLPFDESEDDVK
jgi:putative transposase